MDLAKVGEVYSVQVVGHGSSADVEEKLKAGWVLLTVKIVDHYRVVYVLGKPRKPPQSDARRQEDEDWRRGHLDITDPDHPDYMVHAKSSM